MQAVGVSTSLALERVLRQLEAIFRAVPNPPYPRDLTRLHYLMEKLGRPNNAFPAVIVTGSKGKGSTSNFLAALLQGTGLRVGLLTGPHLHSYRERMKINGLEISIADFVDVFDEVWQAIKNEPFPVYFTRSEILIAMSFVYFAQHKIDIAVLEVSMGGRFDAVNVALRSPLAIFTPIELEHTDALGPTLQDIVYHKSGIMHAGGMAVTARQSLEVAELLYWAAQREGIPLRSSAGYWQYKPETLKVQIVHDKFWQEFQAIDQQGTSHLIGSGLAGTFQVENALTALTAAQVLASQGYCATVDPIALQSAVNPGRLEVIGCDPFVIADGAHTPNAIRELLQSLAILGGTPIWVLGFLRDKLIAQMLELLPLENHAVFLSNISFYRSASATAIKKALKQKPSRLETNLGLAEAIMAARHLATTIPGGYVCVTGSLHLVADARVCMGILDPARHAEADLISKIEGEP